MYYLAAGDFSDLNIVTDAGRSSMMLALAANDP